MFPITVKPASGLLVSCPLHGLHERTVPRTLTDNTNFGLVQSSTPKRRVSGSEASFPLSIRGVEEALPVVKSAYCLGVWT
jgi:hypothetical protein